MYDLVTLQHAVQSDVFREQANPTYPNVYSTLPGECTDGGADRQRCDPVEGLPRKREQQTDLWQLLYRSPGRVFKNVIDEKEWHLA